MTANDTPPRASSVVRLRMLRSVRKGAATASTSLDYPAPRSGCDGPGAGGGEGGIRTLGAGVTGATA